MRPVSNLIMLLLLISLSGCISTKLPLISHTHVGHATTGWHDTPDKEGLLQTAAEEARIAAQHAEFAVESTPNLDAMKMHTVHVRHALDPKAEANGPGLGYGMIHALGGARNHMSFAEGSDDASPNIKNSAGKWRAGANSILERATLILELSDEIMRSTSVEDVSALTEEIRLLAWQNVNGHDANSDGVVGTDENEWGINQLESELKAITAKEVPAYEPVAQRYLLGLFRLPSGKWAFRDNIDYADPDGGGGY